MNYHLCHFLFRHLLKKSWRLQKCEEGLERWNKVGIIVTWILLSRNYLHLYDTHTPNTDNLMVRMRQSCFNVRKQICLGALAASLLWKDIIRVSKWLPPAQHSKYATVAQNPIYSVSQKKQVPPGECCALLLILFWRWLVYSNNLNATTLNYCLPQMWLHLMTLNINFNVRPILQLFVITLCVILSRNFQILVLHI